MGMISKLDDHVSRQIRSNVIINSLESVIRELLLNSLEAKSSIIYIKVDLETLSVCCEDNGVGVSEDDMVWLKHRYYTSKNSAEVAEIHRGEAINSIIECSSNVAIESKVNEGQLKYEVLSVSTNQEKVHGLLKLFFEVNMNFRSGTAVMISRLFSRNPVRYQFLKDLLNADGLKSSLKPVIFELLQGWCTKKFRLYIREARDFQLALSIDQSKSPRDLFHKLFNVPIESLLPVNGTDGTVSIKGFVSVQGSHRANLQFMFHNQHKISLTRNQSTEIRNILKNYGLLAGVRRGVLNKSVSKSPVYHFQISEPSDELREWSTDGYLNSSFALLKIFLLESLERGGYVMNRNTTPSPRKKKPKGGEAFYHESKFVSSILPRTQITLDTSEISVSDLVEGNFVLLKQVLALVILINLGGAIFAIDQHACDERVHLETLLQEFIEKMLDSLYDLCVKCTSSIHFEIPLEAVVDFLNYKRNFFQFGILYDLNGREVTVTHLPQILTKFMDPVSLKQCILQHITDLNDGRKNSNVNADKSWFLSVKHLPTMIQEALISLACKLSVKFGDILSESEMKFLVTSLARCHLPLQCAHGRPTIILLGNLHMNFMKSFEHDETL